MTADELKAMYNPEGSDLRRIQLRMLEMLKFIDQVCTEHHINYWLDSGTLLGAARHKGFIPWDDDTDICMPYEDMLKFKKIMLTENPSKEFVLQCPETDPHIYNGWVILRDLKTEGISDRKMHNLYKYRGLNVDIFPVINTCTPLIRFLCLAFYKGLIKAPINEKPLFKYLKPCAHSLFQVYRYMIKPSCRWVDRLFGERPYYRTDYGCEYSARFYLKDVWPLGRLEFEGYSFAVPHDVDSYLTHVYGDWRKIPAPDEIQTHNYRVRFYV